MLAEESVNMDAFEKLFGKRVGGIKPGLERMRAAYERLGKPSSSIPTILVGGTNGKGTTSGLLWSLLAQNQVCCGLYTSPHLISFTERFQISGKELTESEIISVWDELRETLGTVTYDSLSFFEVATLIALVLFERSKVAVIILEVGLGGRWDATNIVEPIASVIVSVSKDHEAYLGSNLSGILDEKLGICRKGKPLFWGHAGECVDDDACLTRLEVLQADKDTAVWRRGREFGLENDELYIDLPTPDVSFAKGAVPEFLVQAPIFIRQNFSISLSVYAWLVATLPELRLMSVPDILESTKDRPLISSHSMLGRFQSKMIDAGDKRRHVLFDVCHNLDGVRQHVLNLKQNNWLASPALVSILNDKNINEMLDILRVHLGPLLLFQVPSERTLTKAHLDARHQDLTVFESFAEAWQYALINWSKQDQPWVICGSVLAVGKTFEYFEIQAEKNVGFEPF
jgi:dihydrofolate synthase/folylpolyglutamate synthase